MTTLPQSVAPPPDVSPRIECAQVYGGTQAISMAVELPGLEGFLLSQPCQAREGGDIYYMSICGSGLLSRFCLADVVGHGADVAVVSAETHALLRKSINWTDHRRVLRELNRVLVAKGLDSLTTAAMFTYFPPRRSLTFSYAGHPPAWRYSVRDAAWSPLTVSDSEREAERISDIPLAVEEDATFSRGRVRTDVGDLIVITTDGVSDAIGSSSRRFGDDGLADVLRSIDDPSPRLVTERITERLLEFCRVDRFRHDDVSVLALRTLPMSRFDAIRAMFANRVLRQLARWGGGNSH